MEQPSKRWCAVYATESEMIIHGDVTIANNVAINIDNSASGSGGGIYLYQSDLLIMGNCTLGSNQAVRGGGIYASSSIISVHQKGSLLFLNNTAHQIGGGIYTEANTKLIACCLA